jgi:hypothetical protein
LLDLIGDVVKSLSGSGYVDASLRLAKHELPLAKLQAHEQSADLLRERRAHESARENHGRSHALQISAG